MTGMYVCSRCGHSHSIEEFTESHFCRNCGKFLTQQDKSSASKVNSRKMIPSIGPSKKQGRQRCPVCGKKLKNLMRHLSVVHNLRNIEQVRDAIEKSQRVTKKYAVQEYLLMPKSHWDALIAKRLSRKGDESASVEVPRSGIPKGKWKWKYERIIEYVDVCKTPFTSREVADYAGCPIASVQVVFSKIGKDFISDVGKAKHDVRRLLYDKTSKWDKDQALSRYRKGPPGTTAARVHVQIRDVALEFEKCKEQLKEDLKLSQEVISRTLTLIEEYQPFFDEETKYKTSPPRYLQPEMVIGACLYLACKEKESNISQFNIAKVQGHYDTTALSRRVREIQAKLISRIERKQEKPRRDKPRHHKREERYEHGLPKEYEQVIQLIARRPTFTWTTCRAEYPEIAYSTFSGIFRVLSKHNLLERLSLGGGRIKGTYRKTKEFTVGKAIEVMKMRKPTYPRATDTQNVNEMTEEQKAGSPEPLIGFMILHEDPSENSFVEAILITDRNGYPIEYRFTEKIRVSKTQRALYGETLRSYLAQEAIGSKLLEELDNLPTTVLVKDKELLALREKSECPILLLEPDEISLKTHSKYPQDAESTRSILESYKERIPLNQPFKRIAKALQQSQ